MGLISAASTMFDAGSMSAGFGGSMTFIKKLTASGSANLSFVHGTADVVLDDTYKEYYFTFNNIHAATKGADLQFNFTIDGTNYNIAKTTTMVRVLHSEDDSAASMGYYDSMDLAQGTGFQPLFADINNGNDDSGSGYMQLFNPSSTTFVKHYLSHLQISHETPRSMNWLSAGYGNTTSAVTGVQFKFDSGNIDAGDICLYGIA
tara:strand:+ start:432 stop:1043 length:612 start_codon:yes stop_codon:yes gene_type:complete